MKCVLMVVMAIAFALVSSLGYAAVPPAPLPATGQTNCWQHDGGVLITCSGTGQDGDTRAGVVLPSPRFADNGDATVTDNLTGLVWTKESYLKSAKWQDALDYIKQLNSEKFLGWNDWRLPNIIELESLIDLQFQQPAITSPHPFTVDIFAGEYWSSTTSEGPTSARSVKLFDGIVGVSSKSAILSVWPVRAGYVATGAAFPPLPLPRTGQSSCWSAAGVSIACTGTGQDGELQRGVAIPLNRFVDNGDQTVADKLTGLVWAKNANLIPSRDPFFDMDETANDGNVSLANAYAYVAKLNSENYLGQSDWRLPNRKDLVSLFLWGAPTAASLEGSGFVNVDPNALYWTSSTAVNYIPDGEWCGNTGVTVCGKLFNAHPVWPVRGGQYGAVSLSAGSLEFGSEVILTSSPPRTVTIANSGTRDITLFSVDIAGADGGMFSFSSSGQLSSCSADKALPPGASCQVSMTFTPVTSGLKTAQLVITSNDPMNGSRVIPLTGTGLLPPENGVCGPANNGSFLTPPTTGLCSAGAPPASVSGTGPWTWVCAGLYGGTDSPTCSASMTIIPVNGVCGPAANGTYTSPPTTGLCSAGTPPASISGTGPWTWVCSGESGGKDSPPCSAAITTYSVSFAAVSHGTVKGASSQLVKHGGATSAVAAVPDNFYHFTGWTGSNGFHPTTVSPLVVSNVTADMLIIANFAHNELVINSGSSYTNRTAVSLELTPPSGESMVRISNDASTWSKWIFVANPLQWNVAKEDGLKAVFVQVRHAADPVNATYPIYSSTITLDMTPPQGALRINNGAPFTNTPKLQLSFITLEKGAGIDKVCLKESAAACLPEEFKPFNAAFDYDPVSADDGKKTLYATLLDRAGNRSHRFKASIIVDTTPPEGKIVINGNKEVTDSPLVTVKLSAKGAETMQLSVDDGETWSDWEKVVSRKKITLQKGAGVKTVAVRYRDKAGNISPVYQDSIILK